METTTSANPDVQKEMKRAIRLIATSLSRNLSFSDRNRLLAFIRQSTDAQIMDMCAHMEDMLKEEGKLHSPMPKFWKAR